MRKTSAARRPPNNAFVGRKPELGRLTRAMQDARLGRPRIILVSGESGVGKTRLIAEACLRARDFQVAIGHCLELTPANYGSAPWLSAMAALDRASGAPSSNASAVARLLDGQGRATSGVLQGSLPLPDLTAQIHVQVLEAVRRAASRGPLLVAVEDLQWADAATLELLAFLAMNLDGDHVVLASTLTGDQGPDARDQRALAALIRTLARLPGFQELCVQPLPATDAATLVRSILGPNRPQEVVEELASRSQGNPLVAEQLATFVRSGGHGIPQSLSSLLVARVERLPLPERRLMEAMALAGRPLAASQLGSVARLSSASTELALICLAERSLAIEKGESRFAARHALLAAAVAANLAGFRRRNYHVRLAEALLASRDGPEAPYSIQAEAAQHLEAAGRRQEAQAVLVRAAEQALRLASFVDAERCYADAIRLSEENGNIRDRPTRARLKEAAASAAFAAGDFDAASAFLRAALQETHTDLSEDVRLRSLLGSYLLDAGRDAEAITELDTAINLMPTNDQSPRRAHAHGTLAAAWMLAGRYRQSLRLCRVVERAAREQGDAYLESQVLSFMGVDLVNLGAPDAGLAALRRAVSIAEVSARPDGALEATLNLAEMLARIDRLNEAITVASEAALRADAQGLTRRIGVGLRSTAGAALLKAGRWAEAEELLIAALKCGPAGAWRSSLLTTIASLKCLQGNADEAVSFVAGALDSSPARMVDRWPQLAAVRGEVELTRGDLDAARGSVQDALVLLGDSDADQLRAPLLALWARIEAEAAIISRRVRRPTELTRARDAAERIGLAAKALRLGDAPPCGIRAELTSCRAEIARATGMPSTEYWREARLLWEESGQPYRQAYATIREAEARLGSGSRMEARTLLMSAAAAAARLGAVGLEHDIRQVMARARLSGSPDGLPTPVRDSSATGLDALSGREREVLTLIGAGMINAAIAEELFVAPATVATHVAHILAKLGIKSRGEAAAVGGGGLHN